MRRGVPSKVALSATPADEAEAWAAAIMAAELSMPWTRPVPWARMRAKSTLRTPSGKVSLVLIVNAKK